MVTPNRFTEYPLDLVTSASGLSVEVDLAQLVKLVAKQGQWKPRKGTRFVDDGTQRVFTVAQIASMDEVSHDTVQRQYENEPGVETRGNKNPRGKRKRVTLRIPRAVMERVRKRNSNP
jgi:hypothetical protein